MIRGFAFLGALLLCATSLASAAGTLSPKPQGAEVAFVNGIMSDLNARFPTEGDAIRAGYFRYTNEDDTGAISYANLQWQSSDPHHPSQLWYSASGKLLGADFSVLQSTSPSAPHLWGINPARWLDFNAHIHYVLVDAAGKETYGALGTKAFTAAGGSVEHPAADTLVKLGRAKSVSEVKRVFLFPHIWDLIVWVTPNPAGAFADKNPLVTPSAGASTDNM